MSEMLTGPKKIVDGLTEVFRGLTQMCEGMAEQIELLEFTSEEAEDEDKLLPPAKLPAVDTAPRVQDVPHPRKKPGKRPRKQEAPPVVEEQPQEPTEEAPAEETSAADEAKEELPDFPDDSADDLPFDVDTGQKAEPEQPAVTISKDEITAVIVAKIKQKRSNNEKIGQLLKTYGVGQLSELPASKYEAFLADISQL
jgi:hypothetical protein